MSAVPLAANYSETHGYDQFSQLTAMDRANGQSQDWTLEHAGNWAAWAKDATTQTRQHNAVNELVGIAGTVVDPTYDAAGNMNSGPRAADPATPEYYTWDAWNRLTQVRDAECKLVATYAYDGQFRRVRKNSVSGVRDFYYDAWNSLCDVLAGTESVLATTNTYVWGLDLSGSLQGAGGIGGLVTASLVGAGTTSSVFYVYDANGNVMELLDAGAGATSAQYQYDPYGSLIASNGVSAAINAWQFSTKYSDRETGFAYYGYRHYSPCLGRWVSKDPILEQGFRLSLVSPFRSMAKGLDSIDSEAHGDAVNAYRFCRNSAGNTVDPTGLVPPTGSQTGCYPEPKCGLCADECRRCTGILRFVGISPIPFEGDCREMAYFDPLLGGWRFPCCCLLRGLCLTDRGGNWVCRRDSRTGLYCPVCRTWGVCHGGFAHDERFDFDREMTVRCCFPVLETCESRATNPCPLERMPLVVVP